MSAKTPIQLGSYFRGNVNGSALNRKKWINGTVKAGDVPFSAQDGQFLNDWLAAPAPESRHQFGDYGSVSKWCVYRGDIYIEVYGETPEGRAFILRRGPVTADGYVLNERLYSSPLFGSEWKPITPPRHYKKQHVGKMLGKPTW
jgi:hypothetical protein